MTVAVMAAVGLFAAKRAASEEQSLALLPEST